MSKEEKKCYISGKITGLPIADAIDNFNKASLHARFLGYTPINPMEIEPIGDMPKTEEEKWVLYMKSDLKEMLDCNVILMQDNWIDSRGARVEHELAKSLNYQILYMGKHRRNSVYDDYYRNSSILNLNKDKKADSNIFKMIFIILFGILFLFIISYLSK